MHRYASHLNRITEISLCISHCLFVFLPTDEIKSHLQTEDIDECRRKDRYPCYGDCTNTPGSYICVCPPGTNGDATRQNGCRSKDKFTLALKAVTGTQIITLRANAA